ncbi:alpha/beta hydrolase [Paraburkholderia sp. J76]|uniref:alpha/beta fold hydrolase n=1 Tax=Paraburkholderia sp. J76 TaxID=2805439 RepID=UPI002ABD6005|nr:alpha/beta hydrolase [Paraburkholderia sp. J76]
MPAPIQHHYVTINTHSFHYASCGAPDRPLLLFVHGFPECWRAWQAQLAWFGQDYHAVALDTRGVNESGGPAQTGGYRMPHLVDDLRALMDHLGHEQCVLVGHDWGGAIACAFALAHPERLRGLVMINIPHPAIFQRELATNPAQQAASAYIRLFVQEGSEAQVCANDFEYLRGFIVKGGNYESLPSWFDDTLQAEYRHMWSRPGSVRAGLSYYRAAVPHQSGRDSTQPEQLAIAAHALTVQVPTLVIWGEQDKLLLPGCLDGAEQYFAQLCIERIPEGSHWVVHEQGMRVNRAIERFVSDRCE